MENLDKVAELVGLLIGSLLTIFVYSYVVRDNLMYRLAVHVLVGVSAGFAGVIAIRDVILPVIRSATSTETGLAFLIWLVPLILGITLLLKLIPRFSWIGNSSMAVLIAVGSAVGLVGAIIGTLIPQITASYENGLRTLVVAGLTICALAYFHFTGRIESDGQVAMPAWYQYIGVTGRFVITITLAGIFAGLFSTSLVLLGERLDFYFDAFSNLITG